MINIKPATSRNLKTNTLDFEDGTFVGLRSDGKWYCVPVLYENNLYLLNKVRFSKTSDGMPAYNTYNLINESRQYRIVDCSDMEHQAPELQLLYDIYNGSEVGLLVNGLPFVCLNGSWFADFSQNGLMSLCPVFFYHEGWYVAYSYSQYEDCKVHKLTVDYRGVSSTLSTLEGVL